MGRRERHDPACKIPLLQVVLVGLFAIMAVPHAWATAPDGAITDPCAGPSALLALLDRPTIADSTCSVKPYRAVLEIGYDNQIAPKPSNQRLVYYPQAEWRYGLPRGWEAKAFWPNFNRLTPLSGTGAKSTGLSDVGFGAKKEFGYFGNWIFAADTRVDFPSGAKPFTYAGTGVTVNGIASYNVTPQFGLAGQLGVARLAQRDSAGRLRHFSTLKPDIVATYSFFGKLQLYGEVYGATKTGADIHQGDYWFDGGVQYLLTPKVEADVEGGIELSGPQGASAHYFGFGFGFEF